MENRLFNELFASGPAVNTPEKLSDIIGREIETYLKGSTFVDTSQMHQDDPNTVDYANDVLQLIQLSKQMQYEFKRSSNTGDSGSSEGDGEAPSNKAHQRVDSVQPSESVKTGLNHRRFCVPPLFLDVDHDDPLDDYCCNLVGEHFNRANHAPEKDKNRPYQNDVLKTVKKPSKVKLGKAASCESSRSQLSLLTSKKAKTLRVYPKVHSCVELRAASGQNTSRRSQSARAAYSARYYDFEQTHPNLQLSSASTLFPCRNMKNQVPIDNTDSNAIEECETRVVADIDLNKSTILSDNEMNAERENDNETFNGEIIDRSKTNSDMAKSPNIDTWHKVFSSNSQLQPATSESVAIVFAPEPSPTNDQETLRISDVDPSVKPLTHREMTICAIQVLPPLVIKGVCRVQHLSHVSIDGPNFTDNPDNYSTMQNHKYVNLVFEQTELQLQPNAAEDIVGTKYFAIDSPEKIANEQEQPIAVRRQQNLQPSETVTSVFGEISIKPTISPSSYDDDGETVVLRSRSSFNRSDSQSTTYSESFLKTDDEKLLTHHAKPAMHKPQTHKSFKTTSKLCKKVIALDDKKEAKPVEFSESLMKMIDEIFDTEETLPSEPVFAFSQTNLSMFKEHNQSDDHLLDTINEPVVSIVPSKVNCSVQVNALSIDTVLSPNKGVPSIANQIQLDVKSIDLNSTINNRSNNSMATPADTKSNDFPPNCGDHNYENLIEAANLVFESIRNRKIILYKDHKLPFENVPLSCGDQSFPLNSFVCISEKLSSATPLTPSQKCCHHRINLPTFDITKHVTSPPLIPPADLSKEPPSVRLQQIRRMQRQQLVTENPNILRTIDSIHREVLSSKKGKKGTDSNQLHRSKYNNDVIQEAARKVLNQITKLSHQLPQPTVSPYKLQNTDTLGFPIWPSNYLDDSAQQEAEEYLKSVGDGLADKPAQNEYTETQSTGSYNSSTTIESLRSQVSRALLVTHSESNKDSQTNPNCTNSELAANTDDHSSLSQSLLRNTIESTASAHQPSSSSPYSLLSKPVETQSLQTEQSCSVRESDMDTSLMLKSTSSSIAKQMKRIHKRHNSNISESLAAGGSS